MLKKMFDSLLKKVHSPDDFEGVELIFENCNSVVIPANMVERVYLHNMKSSLDAGNSRRVYESTSCEAFELHLSKEALDIKTHFQDYYGDDDSCSFRNHLVTYKDITHVCILRHDGKKVYVAIPYEDDGRYGSEQLKVKFSESYIEITATSPNLLP